ELRVETLNAGTLLVEVEIVNTLSALFPTRWTTLPLLAIENSVEVEVRVDDPTANKYRFVSPGFACTDKVANGEEVPIPMLPVLPCMKNCGDPLLRALLRLKSLPLVARKRVFGATAAPVLP